MFVATFEAVKTTSPLRPRVQAWLESGRRQGRRRVCGGASTTDRSAQTSTSRARLSDLSCRDLRHRVPVDGAARQHLRPRSRARVCPRPVHSGVRRGYPTDGAQEPLRRGLHPAREQMPDVAALMPVQLAAPSLVQRERGFAHGHLVMPRADDQPALRGRRRLDATGSRRPTSPARRRRSAAARWCPAPTAPTGPDGRRSSRSGRRSVCTPPRRRPVSRCDTSAATGLPIDTPDTAIALAWGRSHRTTARTSDTTRIMPATLASGSMLG